MQSVSDDVAIDVVPSRIILMRRRAARQDAASGVVERRSGRHMIRPRFAAVALFAPWIVAVGCSVSSDDPVDEELATATDSIESAEDALGYAGVGAIGSRGTGLLATKGIVSQNSLLPGALGNPSYVNQLRALKTASLTASSIQTVTHYDEAWFTLMRYTVHCALPLGATIPVYDPKLGTDVELKGNIGLAPRWATDPLDAPGEGWVTACLLAHANNFGERVDILLVGNHPALDRPLGHEPMGVQEAAFYGNLFTPPNAKYLFSCIGADVYACDTDGQLSADLKRRICGSSPDCGFDVNGRCWSPESAVSDACTKAPGDTEVFKHCYSVPGSPPSAIPFAEVITVNLEPTDFRDAHPQCNKPQLPGDAAFCSHALCTQGAPLAPTCDRCVQAICDADPFCCHTGWDHLCVAQVDDRCRCLEGRPRSSCDACADLVDSQPGHAYCARGWDSLCIREMEAIGCDTCP